jgi:hypothetical protein
MIPQRSHHGLDDGNGVRIRISACRKRLRVARAAHRSDVAVLSDDQSQIRITNDGIEAGKGSVNAATSSLREEAERA